jgi:hypothetical protein
MSFDLAADVSAPPGPIDLGVLPSELDKGIAWRAAIGLVVLACVSHKFGPPQKSWLFEVMPRSGVDTLTHCSGSDGATLGHAANLLRPPPLPARCDPARGLALPALHLDHLRVA